MIRLKHGCRLVRWARFLPFVFLFQTIGCLPDGGFRQVLGENIVFSSAVVIQTITAVIFNTLFGVQ